VPRKTTGPKDQAVLGVGKCHLHGDQLHVRSIDTFFGSNRNAPRT